MYRNSCIKEAELCLHSQKGPKTFFVIRPCMQVTQYAGVLIYITTYPCVAHFSHDKPICMLSVILFCPDYTPLHARGQTFSQTEPTCPGWANLTRTKSHHCMPWVIVPMWCPMTARCMYKQTRNKVHWKVGLGLLHVHVCLQNMSTKWGNRLVPPFCKAGRMITLSLRNGINTHS